MTYLDHPSRPLGRILRRTAFLGAALPALVAFGCGSDLGSNELGDEPLGELHERSVAGDFGTWTAWTMPVNTCFTRFTTSDPARQGEILNTTEYATMKGVAMTGLGETWGRVPGVSFVNAGDCTSAMPNHLHLVLSRGGGGFCGGGVGATCEVRGQPTLTGWENGFKGLLAHEVGHALGLAHEHKRNDANPTSCEANRVAGCVACKASIDAGQACSAANYNACFNGIGVTPAPPVASSQTFTTSSKTYQTMQQILWDNQTDNNLERLTIYDPRSVMNYCAVPNGRDPNDFMPTPLDLLGLEMTYPLTTGHKIGCLRGCFHSSAGAITRTDALIQTHWAERGGLGASIMVSGSPVPSINTANFAQGTSNISYVFLAPRTGASLTASGTLVNSNAAHAALVVAVDQI